MSRFTHVVPQQLNPPQSTQPPPVLLVEVALVEDEPPALLVEALEAELEVELLSPPDPPLPAELSLGSLETSPPQPQANSEAARPTQETPSLRNRGMREPPR